MQNKQNVAHDTIKNILTRDFILTFFALFTFIATIYALIPTLPIYFEKLGSNVTEIGILIGVYGISSLVCRFVVGGALLKYSEKISYDCWLIALSSQLPCFSCSSSFLALFRDQVSSGCSYGIHRYSRPGLRCQHHLSDIPC
jgi:hypothetical protein